MKRIEVLEKIKICEKNKEFNTHVDPIDMDNYYKVTKDFQYIKRGWQKIINGIRRTFVVVPFTNGIWKKYKGKCFGKDKIKGIKNAILTCNHVDMFDCLVVKKALSNHRVYITAGEFNNQKGRFGDLMRAGRMMPFGSDIACQKNMNKAIEKLLKTNNYVMFYPEEAMWWHYKKPRPLKNGAFHYAVKHNVPVIPLFITFDKLDTFIEEGVNNDRFTVHVLDPIYPDPDSPRNQNVEQMKNTNYLSWKKKYEEYYNEKLEY